MVTRDWELGGWRKIGRYPSPSSKPRGKIFPRLSVGGEPFLTLREMMRFLFSVVEKEASSIEESVLSLDFHQKQSPSQRPG